MSKKSFILYNDQCEVFHELSDADAGRLIKAIIDTQNHLITQSPPDEPTGLSGLLKAIHKPFSSHLSRDYDKWLMLCERNKSNGIKGGRPNHKPSRPQTNPNEPDTVTDTVTVTDTENDKNIKKKILKEKTLTLPFFVNEKLFNDFIEVRKKLKAINSDAALEKLINRMHKFHENGHNVNELIEDAIVGSWKTIYEPKQNQRVNNYGKQTDRFAAVKEQMRREDEIKYGDGS